MAGRLVPVLFGMGLVIGAAGCQYYKDAVRSRERFEPRFKQLRVGDSYEKMTELLGDPTHYCAIRIMEGYDMTAPALRVEAYEIYRIGDRDYRARFAQRSPEENPGNRITELKVLSFPDDCAGGQLR